MMIVPPPRFTDLDVTSLGAHWTSRFLENGVPLDDLQATLDSVDSWEGWCRAWEQTGDGNVRRAEDAAAAGFDRTASELQLVAAVEYHFAKFLFVHDPKSLMALEAKAVASYRSACQGLLWPGRPVAVPFEELELPGVLRVPSDADGPVPAVLVVPGLDATKEEMHRLSDVFLRRGMATFAFDGPGQGELDVFTALRPDFEKVAAAVVDHLSELPEVNSGQIAAVGVSLGGYFVCRAAAADSRLAAVACIGGCFDFGGSWGSLSPLSRLAFQARSGATNEADAEHRAASFSMTAATVSTDVPVLVVHGERDRLFPPEQAHALHRHFAPNATLLMDQRGNHVLHNLAYRIRPAVADWIRQRLAG